MGFSTINQPFLGTPIWGNPHIYLVWNGKSPLRRFQSCPIFRIKAQVPPLTIEDSKGPSINLVVGKDCIHWVLLVGAILQYLIKYGHFQKWGYPPNWMVDKGKSYIQIDDLGVPPWLRKPPYNTVNSVEEILHQLTGDTQGLCWLAWWNLTWFRR